MPKPIGVQLYSVRDVLVQDVANLIDDGVRELPLVERIAQPDIDRYNILDVPEHRLDELFSPRLRDNVACEQWVHPELHLSSAQVRRRAPARTSRRYSMSFTKSRSV